MKRDLRRYRRMGLTCGVVLVVGAVAMTTTWSAGQGMLLAAAQVGVLLSAVGAGACVYKMHRLGKATEPVDFTAGVATYPLDDLGSFR
mgnify:CR=1 FL=1